MRKKYLFIILLGVLWGCAQVVERVPEQAASPRPSQSPLANIATIPSEEPEQDTAKAEDLGHVFAKTVFDGVVKTSYVILTFVDMADTSRTYQLIIGDKERQKDFPWEVQTVGAGYFFIELPQGEYRISMITIPVGQKKAEEPMDLVFRVDAQETNYLGTLKVVGTKEKVKLGGVPVIKPGFEYQAAVLDEAQEAQAEFKRRFPDQGRSFIVNLMQLHQADNLSDPESEMETP